MQDSPQLAASSGWLSGFKLSEVWVRFLLALVGLVLAFGAALFSTVLRESGSVWATVALASLALVLAVLVGVTTVPYLARRVAGERLRDAFDYDVTRVGIFYVVAILVIAIAALNTGNNLLYIIVAAMLSAILVSGIASAAVLRRLELDVHLPDYVFAGRPVLAKIILHNPRRHLPSFSVSVVPRAEHKTSRRWQWAPSTFSFPPSRPADRQWLRLPDRRLRRVVQDGAPPGIFSGNVYFPYLPAQRRMNADLELRFARRGVYRQQTFGLATRFPFAFLTKTRRVSLLREVVVYPPVEMTDEFLEMLPLITGELESWVRGRGNDLYRIREALPEDSARHVDWKATAKSGSLKVREFTREDERKLRIVFDNPAKGVVPAEAYERAVALAASLAWHFSTEDAEITYLAQDYGGGRDTHQFLRHLATVQPGSEKSLVEELPASGDYNIILTARPRGTIPTALWTGSYFIFIGDPR